MQNIQPHLRKLIRHKLKSLMISSIDVGGRVYLSRPNEAWLEEVPCCLIYHTGETSNDEKRRPRKYKNMLTVNIQFLCRFEKLEEVDDWLDSRAYEAQKAIEADKYLGFDFIRDTELRSTLPTTIESSGDENVESLTLTYEITYFDELLYILQQPDEWLKFQAKYLTPEAEDLVTIREN